LASPHPLNPTVRDESRECPVVTVAQASTHPSPDSHSTPDSTGPRHAALFSPGVPLLNPTRSLWARWHQLKDDPAQARRYAEEALRIADRCEYRLKQADCQSFLAALSQEEGDTDAAIRHARTAYERAWCDGPPHCYKPALDRATRLLNSLNADPPPLP